MTTISIKAMATMDGTILIKAIGEISPILTGIMEVLMTISMVLGTILDQGLMEETETVEVFQVLLETITPKKVHLGLIGVGIQGKNLPLYQKSRFVVKEVIQP